MYCWQPFADHTWWCQKKRIHPHCCKKLKERKEGTCLVGGFNPSEKYELVNGKDDIPYIIENNPFMCETL